MLTSFYFCFLNRKLMALLIIFCVMDAFGKCLNELMPNL